MTKKSLPHSPSRTALNDPARSPTETVDRLGVYVMSSIGVVGVALVCGIQIAYQPPFQAHLLIALPTVLLTCLLPFGLLIGWRTRKRFRMQAKAERIEIPPNPVDVNNRVAA